MASQPSLPNMTTNRKWGSLNEFNANIENTIETAQVLVTSAQLLALKTTPVNIIPAGVQTGEVIMVDYAAMTYTFKTTAYTLNAGTLKLFYGTVANGHPLTADLSTNFLTAAASRVQFAFISQDIILDTIANMCQQGIYIGNDGTANYTLGDATLTVTVLYSKTTP